MSEHEQVSGNNQQEPNSAAEEWNFQPPAVVEMTTEGVPRPPEVIELPDTQYDKQFFPPAPVEGTTAIQTNNSQPTEIEIVEQPTSKEEQGRSQAETEYREMEQQYIEELKKLNEAYLNHKYNQAEYEAKRRVLEYYYLDRLNKMRDTYSELKDDPRFVDIPNILAEENAAAEQQKEQAKAEAEQQKEQAKAEAEQNNREDTKQKDGDDTEQGGKDDAEHSEQDDAEHSEQDDDEQQERDEDEQKERDDDEQKERDDDEQKERDEDEQKEKDKAESEEKAKDEQENKSDKEKELAEIEKEIAAVDKLYEEKLSRKNTGNREVIENLKKQIKTARAELGKAEHDLAESYAKNRGLFGGKNRAAFHEKQERYKEQLNECLRLEAELNYKLSQQKDGELINFEKNKLIERIKAGDLTSEKAGQLLAEKWSEIDKTTKSEISVKFVDSYINEQKSLAAATCKQIDEGNNYRKFVSKILNSKKLRTILAVAGAAGLAATGIGLATGALAFTIGYSAGGIALGAGKGALSGAIMSRQDSRNSAVRSFVDSDKIKADLSSINYEAIENGQDIANVTNWLMKQYDAANQADRHSNRKRTAIAMGLGAAIGGTMSGVHINQVTTETREGYTTSHYEPTEIKAANLEDVNHAKGYGTQQLYRELGGDGESYFSSGAHEQMAEIIKKYGMTVGKNDWTYPGPLNEWPEVAREAFSEVANEWAKQGLVPATKIGGQPVYDAVTYTVDKLIESKLYNFFTQAGAIVEAGVLGGVISGIRNRVAKTESMPEVKPAPEVTSALPVQPIQETAPEATTQEAAQPDQAPTQEGEAAPESNYDTTTRNTFQNRVNDQLLEFMTSDADYNGLDSNTMRFRLMELPVDVRNEVINYMDTHSDERHGRALRDEINVMRSEGQL